MNAVSAAVFLGLVALCAGNAVVAPVQQYYYPSAYTGYPSAYTGYPTGYTGYSSVGYAPQTVKYVQPAVADVKYVQQYAVPSTQQYVYKSPSVGYVQPSVYSSPVVSSYGYGNGVYSPSYYYPSSASYVYGIGKK